MRRQRSLAWRIALTFLAADVLLVLAAFAAIKPVLLSSVDGVQLGPAIVIEAAASGLSRDARGSPSLEQSKRLKRLLGESPSAWLILRAEGKVLRVGSIPRSAQSTFSSLPASLETAEFRASPHGKPLGDLAFERRETAVGVAEIMAGGVDPGTIGWDDWFAYLVSSDIIWAIPLLVSLAIPAVLVATPVALGGLRIVTAEAAELGPDRPEARLPPEMTPRELRPLTSAINAALDRLSMELTRQRRFIADVSHELRTPLAIVGMRIANLQDSAAKSELTRGHQRLSNMVGQMLDAERLTLAAPVHQRVDLVELTREAVADFAPLAIEAGHTIALDCQPGPITTRGDPRAIARAVNNLLGNAIAHSGAPGKIDVVVGQDGAIDVIDDGPGFLPEARDRAFEPFYRGGYDADGCGLGLHLVQEIMHAHGGTAVLPDGGGGRVRLQFPLADRADA